MCLVTEHPRTSLEHASSPRQSTDTIRQLQSTQEGGKKKKRKKKQNKKEKENRKENAQTLMHSNASHFSLSDYREDVSNRNWSDEFQQASVESVRRQEVI